MAQEEGLLLPPEEEELLLLLVLEFIALVESSVVLFTTMVDHSFIHSFIILIIHNKNIIYKIILPSRPGSSS